MSKKIRNISVLILILLTTSFIIFSYPKPKKEEKIISYEVNPLKQKLSFYWKDDKDQTFKSIANLKNWLETKDEKLIFAMNGGMFNSNNSPQGLFIQNQQTLVPIDTTSGEGNFYLKPNGIFYITTDKKGIICKTEDFTDNGKILYATQSGPLLLINGKIHPAFKEGSTNLHIRNGVGILPNGKILFAMSKEPINFYDFALYFQHQGCKNALYLDGFVSRTYLPEKNWKQTDGNIGVIIAVTERN